jgi:hypothetical protein
MTTLVLEMEPVAVDVTITNQFLTVDLADGRRIAVPTAWYPRLARATPQERLNWQLLGAGYAIEWPDLDEHVGIEGLLGGRRSGESKKSFRRWLAGRSRAMNIARKRSGRKSESPRRPKSRSHVGKQKVRRRG